MGMNCWEFKECKKGDSCPAFNDRSADGLNHGKNAGRICWAVGGTLCGGVVQGEFAHKMTTCMACDFYSLVRREEGVNMKTLKPGQKYTPRTPSS